jgi:cytochrome b6-f complex iron-sulfur subunit
VTVLGIAASTFAVAVVAVLFGLLILLLLASLARARRSAKKPAVATVPAAAPAAGPAPAGPKPKTVLSRRDFFRGGLLASLGVFTAQFGGATLAFLWPNLAGGFGGVITLTDSPDSILDQIRSSRQPYYFGAGRFYLINYNGDGDQPGGPYEGFSAEVTGSGRLMALYQKCAHLGCRVPFCDQSQWFECPCHGSKYNYAGEYESGPAPAGLQRFPVRVQGAEVTVDTGNPGPNPPRGTDTIRQAPEGPFCVGGV